MREEVVMTKAKLRMPLKIRRLYNNLNTIILFIDHRKFNSLRRRFSLPKEAVGCVFNESRIVFIDGDALKEGGYTQKEINYIYLHELSHIMLDSGDEKMVDMAAEELASMHGIEIDNECAIIE